MNNHILQSMEGLLRQLVQNTRGGGGSATVGRPQPADGYGGVQGRVNKDISEQQRAAWNSR